MTLAELWSRLAEPLALRMPWAPPPERPVALIGFGKSGKSLIAAALARSGSFARYPSEGNLRLFMAGLYPWHESRFESPPLWWDPAATAEYAARLYAGPHGGRIRKAVGLYQALRRRPVVLDNGNVTYWLADFLRLFPDARVVSVLRDPRQVVPEVAARLQRKIMLSSRYDTLGPPDEDAVLERLTDRWIDCRKVIDCLERERRTHVVAYERLCAEPEAALKELFAWLGAPPPAALPRFRPVNVRQPGAERVDQHLRMRLCRSDYDRYVGSAKSPSIAPTAQHL